MRTLDEVIKNLEDGTEHLSAMLISRETWTDALQWLKGYKAHIELDKLRDKCEAENEPLSWDELKQMEGKPVWVEVDGNWYGKFWAFVEVENDAYVSFYQKGQDYPEDLWKRDMCKTWQAYRQERTE